MQNNGYFNKSVVYIAYDNSLETFGFTINFKTQFKLRDFKPQVKNGNLPIFEGGPVATNQLFYVHTAGKLISNSEPISDKIFFGGNFNDMLQAIESGELNESNLKIFIGYCGWGKDQLQNEIKANHWFTNKAKQVTVFETNYADIYSNELQKIKTSYKIFGDIANTPSLN